MCLLIYILKVSFEMNEKDLSGLNKRKIVQLFASKLDLTIESGNCDDIATSELVVIVKELSDVINPASVFEQEPIP